MAWPRGACLALQLGRRQRNRFAPPVRPANRTGVVREPRALAPRTIDHVWHLDGLVTAALSLPRLGILPLWQRWHSRTPSDRYPFVERFSAARAIQRGSVGVLSHPQALMF